MARSNYSFYVYIMASVTRILYVGVTNDLVRRAEEHRDGTNEGFTKKYQTHKLVYYEYWTDIKSAIHREKELKGWRRSKKIALIQNDNPTWRDIYPEIAQ
ncbi:MAG: GIY-YIG nuclease family protein [Candidatus Magasanikbacteria bacterium]|nr:GIY-YIG nuclease family protein [Candidatus Magasanikbacteria bacterium]